MIAAIVPAAGRSTRMGQPKLLIEIEGTPMIGRVVAALHDGGADRVVVVPPADGPDAAAIAAAALAAGAEVVVPEVQPAEMRDSVELALAVLDVDPRPDLILLTPGDVPGLHADLVDRLVGESAAHPGRILVPTHEGRRGHPIVLPWEIAVHVRDLPEDAGINRLVEAHADQIVEIPVDLEMDDVDTPADLDRWRSLATGMTVQVRLFAIAREKAGRSEIEVNLPDPATVADLRRALADRFPDLDSVTLGAMIAVDEEYAGDAAIIGPASRLAMIPPVSGGSDEA